MLNGSSPRPSEARAGIAKGKRFDLLRSRIGLRLSGTTGAAASGSKSRNLQRAINALPRWPLYMLGLTPGVWIFYLALNDKPAPIL